MSQSLIYALINKKDPTEEQFIKQAENNAWTALQFVYGMRLGNTDVKNVFLLDQLETHIDKTLDDIRNIKQIHTAKKIQKKKKAKK